MSFLSMRHIRLMLPCPPPTTKRAWGDYYYARSLADALERTGVKTQFHFATRHAPRRLRNRLRLRQLFVRPGGIDLVIRGRVPYRPQRRRPLFMWLISSPDSLTDEELSHVEHTFVASRSFCKKLQRQGYSASYLAQCTDQRLFHHSRADGSARSDVLFVGNRRDYAPREVVTDLVAAGLPMSVWGRGWKERLPADVYKGLHIPNDELCKYYASARVVLNDHTSDMLNEGFVSNRVFDVLASGSAVVTEDMEDLSEMSSPHLFRYRPGGAKDAVLQALDAPAATVNGFSEDIRRDWSFDARAATLVSEIFGSKTQHRTVHAGAVGQAGKSPTTTKEI